MAAMFARERVAQIYFDANFKPPTVVHVKIKFCFALLCFFVRAVRRVASSPEPARFSWIATSGNEIVRRAIDKAAK